MPIVKILARVMKPNSTKISERCGRHMPCHKYIAEYIKLRIELRLLLDFEMISTVKTVAKGNINEFIIAPKSKNIDISSHFGGVKFISSLESVVRRPKNNVISDMQIHVANVFLLNAPTTIKAMTDIPRQLAVFTSNTLSTPKVWLIS